jgi:hypothetical protein
MQLEFVLQAKVERQTVDLSEYPDLVVIYVGMRVNALTGIIVRDSGGTGFWHET